MSPRAMNCPNRHSEPELPCSASEADGTGRISARRQLFTFVCRAYDAVYALHMAAHYLSCWRRKNPPKKEETEENSVAMQIDGCYKERFGPCGHWAVRGCPLKEIHGPEQPR